MQSRDFQANSEQEIVSKKIKILCRIPIQIHARPSFSGGNGPNMAQPENSGTMSDSHYRQAVPIILPILSPNMYQGVEQEDGAQ